MGQFDGKVAIVTGSEAGIGAAVVLKLSSEDASAERCVERALSEFGRLACW